jgi:hypothetical protein
LNERMKLGENDESKMLMVGDEVPRRFVNLTLCHLATINHFQTMGDRMGTEVGEAIGDQWACTIKLFTAIIYIFS